jgi:hypothetical protein
MKTKSEILDELTIEVDKLHSLLKDRQEGLFTWWGFLYDNLQRIKEIEEEL